MRNNVLRTVVIGVVTCITLFVLFVVYLAYNWDVKERDRYYVTATDGKKFKMSYELLSARPGCRIWLNYRGDRAQIVVPANKQARMSICFFCTKTTISHITGFCTAWVNPKQTEKHWQY